MTQEQLPPRRDGPRRAAGVGKTIEDLRRRAVAQEVDHLQELLATDPRDQEARKRLQELRRD